MINRKRPLEALNFCLASLDRTSRACSWHADYEPRIALQALTRFRKADLDPGSPPPVELQPYPHFDLLHTMALAAFLVHDGPSTFALSILRRAYHANPFLSRMVRREEQVRVEGSDYAGKQLAQEGMLYVHRFIRIWVNVPGLEDWLKTCKDDVEMRQCDALGCKNMEDSEGRLSVCARCRQAWYCGVECQKKDWNAGGHKRRCKPPTAFPFPQ
ncbi:hypothetical protein FN846DRAFT_415507 [Sphaerosporella brunnea]|uniref:phytol kinase n=1 Tax=Sphaerosporella brunnea TaxID=1250544 RepID=A0A5J5EHH4_9PEZI|nr:hypothetical protein FN846DRAFT_415507 [Sphaerosporella brunnea]